MVALIQSENHAANKGKTAGRYQFDTHPTGIGLTLPVGDSQMQLKSGENPQLMAFYIVNSSLSLTIYLSLPHSSL